MSTFAAADSAGIGWLRWLIELSILLVASATIAALAWLMPDVRAWFAGTLGLGWAVVGVFAVATLLALLHNPFSLIRAWRRWLAGAAAAGVLIGGAAFIRGDSGAFYAYGISGEWGYALTGGNVGIAILGFSVALILIILLLIPNAARWYWIALKYAGIGLWMSVAAAAAGLSIAGVWLFKATATAMGSAVNMIGKGKDGGAAPKQRAPKKAKQVEMEANQPEANATVLPTSTSKNGWQLPRWTFSRPPSTTRWTTLLSPECRRRSRKPWPNTACTWMWKT